MEQVENIQIKKKQLHDEIGFLVCSFGNHFDKKHGDWVKLQYTNDSFFELDTWNSRILLKQGSGDYDFWCGFKGEIKQNLGMNFGSFECNISLELLQFYLNNLDSIVSECFYSA